MTLELESSADVEVPISALEHWSFCPRQCGLIHVEQTFDENLYTMRGRLAHERVDTGEATYTPAGVRVLRAVTLWSERLGLRGKSDVVELRPEGPYPVEYKVGRRHGIHADLQLCGQALCLEEMLGMPVRRGAVYYGATRRRHEVELDARLRERTLAAVEGIRGMLVAQTLPPALNDRRCPKCSLLDSCLPAVVTARDRLRGLQGALFRPLELADDDA